MARSSHIEESMSGGVQAVTQAGGMLKEEDPESKVSWGDKGEPRLKPSKCKYNLTYQTRFQSNFRVSLEYCLKSS